MASLGSRHHAWHRLSDFHTAYVISPCETATRQGHCCLFPSPLRNRLLLWLVLSSTNERPFGPEPDCSETSFQTRSSRPVGVPLASARGIHPNVWLGARTAFTR